MLIMDARNRPNTKEFMKRLQSPGARYMFEKVLLRPIPPEQSIEEWIVETERAGFNKVVFLGRDLETATGFKISNDFVADTVRQYPDRVVGVAGIDPMKGRAALVELERAVKELKLRGASIDPRNFKVLPNDRRLYPLYEKCAELGVPMFITIGPMPSAGAYLASGQPLPVDEVATDFPTLDIVCAHGGWPYALEMIAIAWRRTNVYFDTSVYWFNPGAEVVVEAANTIIPDKVIFASAFPFAPMKETIDRFLKLPFKPDVLPKVLYQNAARLLKLETA
jgi:uncharacterized protein